MFKRSSGILAHPTSFPGKYGIGDLGRYAYEFIDFLHKGNQSLWQVLPLNPTGFGDSPYQSFSTFAGNPLLISPDILLDEGMISDDDLKNINFDYSFDDTKIDYLETYKFKLAIFRKAFDTFKESPRFILKRLQFEKFCNENESWLEDYVLFTAIKNHFIDKRKDVVINIDADIYNTKDIDEDIFDYINFAQKNTKLTRHQINDYYYGAVWLSWPNELKERDPCAIEKWRKRLEYEVYFHKFLQFEFFSQWLSLKKYANIHNIKIIGDIPIFVALDSADLWANKNLFMLDENGYPTEVAGVPPDYFSQTGQLWGNPLYYWPAHKETNYAWWIRRVSYILKNVDILRIDHFRGFESYWAVPYGEKTAVNGKWEKGPGRDLFDAIKQAVGDLPVIAEDLGIITENVRKLLESLDLPGMRVLQFAFDGRPKNANIPHNIENSNVVLYTGTHDNDTTVGWYMKASERERDQFRRYMDIHGDDPSWSIIKLAFLSTAVFALFPIQDVLSLGSESRMNRPGVMEGNWRFRFSKQMLTADIAERLEYLSNLTDRNIESQLI